MSSFGLSGLYYCRIPFPLPLDSVWSIRFGAVRMLELAIIMHYSWWPWSSFVIADLRPWAADQLIVMCHNWDIHSVHYTSSCFAQWYLPNHWLQIVAYSGYCCCKETMLLSFISGSIQVHPFLLAPLKFEHAPHFTRCGLAGTYSNFTSVVRKALTSNTVSPTFRFHQRHKNFLYNRWRENCVFAGIATAASFLFIHPNENIV